MDAERLKRVVMYAYHTVPYYNNLINDKQIDIDNLNFPKDLDLFEIVTKEKIKELGWANFVSQEYLDSNFNIMNSRDVRIERTTGTTQEPMEIPWLNTDYYASILNHWRFRQSRFNITSSSRKCDNVRNRYSNQPYFIDLTINNMKINNYLLSYKHILNILDNLYLFQPEWLYIQPSLLFVLIKIAKEKNKPFPDSIRYIEYVGEPLLEYYRKFIEDYVNVPCSNMYGCTETNGIAYECANGHFHLLSNNVYTEILDSTNIPVFEEPGNVCVTGYYNTIMPMIRYKLNDYGILHSGKTCGCGNDNSILELCITRLPQCLIFDDKELCSTGAIYYPISELNIIQPQKSDVLFHLKLNDLKNYVITFCIDNFTTNDKDLMELSFKSIMSLYGLSNIDFTFAYVKNVKEVQADNSIGILRLF